MDSYVWTLILLEGRRSFGEKYYDLEDYYEKYSDFRRRKNDVWFNDAPFFERRNCEFFANKEKRKKPDIANNKKKLLMAENRFIAIKGLYLSIFFPIHKKCIQRLLI